MIGRTICRMEQHERQLLRLLAGRDGMENIFMLPTEGLEMDISVNGVVVHWTRLLIHPI